MSNVPTDNKPSRSPAHIKLKFPAKEEENPSRRLAWIKLVQIKPFFPPKNLKNLDVARIKLATITPN